jgi:hypothetical protein
VPPLTRPPLTGPFPTRPSPTRRQALAAAFALACAAGCHGRGAPAEAPSPPSQTRPPPPDPLVAILDTEQRLIAAYDATAAAHPALATRLAPMRADHAEHASALERALGRTPPATLGTSSPGTGSAGAGTPTPAPPRVPGNRTRALAALRAAERAAAAARASAAETAPADRAVLLASIAACEASHEVLLR